MNPRIHLEAASVALVRASESLAGALRVAAALEVDEPGLQEALESVAGNLEEARGEMDDAVEGAKAWEMTPGPDELAWVSQARRIADTVDDALWACRGATSVSALHVARVLKPLGDSIALCLARLATVLPEVRHG